MKRKIGNEKYFGRNKYHKTFSNNFACFNACVYHVWWELAKARKDWGCRTLFLDTKIFFCLHVGNVCVFAYQVCELKKKYFFLQLIKVKFKRLIIPCIVFSLFYSFLFPPGINILNYIYGLVNGFGHMWFLPMLLWCFVATYFLLKVRMKEEIKLIGLLCLSIFPSSLIPLPFRMASTMYYLFYFYLAYYIWNHRKLVVKYLATNKIIISGSILFLIVLFHLTLYYEIIHYHIRL